MASIVQLSNQLSQAQVRVNSRSRCVPLPRSRPRKLFHAASLATPSEGRGGAVQPFFPRQMPQP